MKNKSVGFYLSAICVLLTLVATIIYGFSGLKEGYITALLIVDIVVGVAGLALTFKFKSQFVGLISVVFAVILGATTVLSLMSQMNEIGYVIAGLDQFTVIKSYIISLIFMCVGLVCSLVVPFVGITDKE